MNVEICHSPPNSLSRAHPHAVTATPSGNDYTYDANGSMIARIALENGVPVTCTFALNVDNKIVDVDKNGADQVDFVYDGDGMRIKSTLNGVTTTFIGGRLEWKGTVESMVKYYNLGGSMALRTGNTSGVTNLTYLLGDHLGSTSLTANYDGASPVTQLYKPWAKCATPAAACPPSTPTPGNIPI